MAGIYLSIEEKVGSEVFSKRRSTSRFEEVIPICCDLMMMFDNVDPYGDKHWQDRALESFSKVIDEKTEQYESDIEEKVLYKTRKSRIEDWMSKLIETEKKQHERLTLLYDLREMADVALEHNGTIVYVGD